MRGRVVVVKFLDIRYLVGYIFVQSAGDRPCTSHKVEKRQHEGAGRSAESLVACLEWETCLPEGTVC